MGKRRRAGAAEADEGDNEGEASAMQTTMRPMGERRKAMSRRMMREKEREKEIRRIWEIFKFSSS